MICARSVLLEIVLPSDDDETSPPALDYFQARAGDRVVKIATMTSPTEAELAAARLRSEGIECFVGNAMSAAQLGAYGPGFSKVDLNVHQSDETEAKRILDAIAAARDRRLRPSPEACPKCGSTEIVERTRNGLVPAVVVFMLGLVLVGMRNDIDFLPGVILVAAIVFFVLMRTRWMCLHCGNIWKHAAPMTAENEEE